MDHLTLKALPVTMTDQGVFEAVISTETVDREKDIVRADAMVMALKKWPRPIPLAWEHSTDPDDIFGSIEPMTVRNVDGEVHAGGTVDLESKTGQDAWRSFKARSLGFSFGYMLPEGGWKDREGGGRDITELDVFEVTACRAPMNNDTRVTLTKHAEALREQADEVERKVQEDAPEWAKAIEDLTTKLDELSTRVGRQEESANQPSDPELASLRKTADATALHVMSDGEHLSKPPEKVEEPKPDLPPLGEIRQKSRDVMLAVLSDQPIEEKEG